MPTAHLLASTAATLAQRLHARLFALTAVGTAIMRGVRDAMRLHALKHGHPTQKRSLLFSRVKRAVRWANMLNATLAGARVVVTGVAPTPKPPPELPDLATITVPMASIPRVPSSAQKPLMPRPTVSMVRAFNTQSIGAILTQICQDIGLDERAPEWPADLIGITQTPAAWLAERFPLNPAPQPRDALNPRTAGEPAGAHRVATPQIGLRSRPFAAIGWPHDDLPFRSIRDPLPG